MWLEIGLILLVAAVVLGLIVWGIRSSRRAGALDQKVAQLEAALAQQQAAAAVSALPPPTGEALDELELGRLEAAEKRAGREQEKPE